MGEFDVKVESGDEIDGKIESGGEIVAKLRAGTRLLQGGERGRDWWKG